MVRSLPSPTAVAELPLGRHISPMPHFLVEADTVLATVPDESIQIDYASLVPSESSAFPLSTSEGVTTNRATTVSTTEL